MGAGNALFFLVNVLFELFMAALLLRVLLQLVRADFYNPLSQLVWKITNPLAQPLRAVIPRYRKLDTATLFVLFVVAVIYIAVVSWMLGAGVPVLAMLWFALLKCIVLTINLYTLSLFVQAILSWMGPGGRNPTAEILWSLNEPLLAPVRRFIPPIGGFDLSPLAVMLALQVLIRLVPLPVLFR
ncbi:MAG: YggT family protein [Stagnimonas sp.]|nr:YggT family protein [Stagnimonas sp.]